MVIDVLVPAAVMLPPAGHMTRLNCSRSLREEKSLLNLKSGRDLLNRWTGRAETDGTSATACDVADGVRTICSTQDKLTGDGGCSVWL